MVLPVLPKAAPLLQTRHVYYKRVMVQYLCTYNSTFKLMFNIAAAGKLSRRASPVFEKKKESMQCSVADGCIGHWWTNTFETLLEERSLSMQQLELDLVPNIRFHENRNGHKVMMAINGYPLIDIFECTEYQLIHLAKKIFRKFPKIAFLEFILILPQVFYLVDSTEI